MTTRGNDSSADGKMHRFDRERGVRREAAICSDLGIHANIAASTCRAFRADHRVSAAGRYPLFYARSIAVSAAGIASCTQLPRASLPCISDGA